MSQIEQQSGGDPFSLSIFHQSVYFEGQPPFTMSGNTYTNVQSGGSPQVRRTRQTMLYPYVDDEEWYFRLPLLPLVESELAARGVAFETRLDDNFWSQKAREERLKAMMESGTSSQEALRQLPVNTRDFLLLNQHAMLEYSSIADICTLISAAAERFPRARIAVLTTNRESGWQLKSLIDGGLSNPNSFVAFDELSDEELERRWPENNFPRLLIGTPDSLANNNLMGGVWTFDQIFIVDERLLLRESLFDYMVSTRNRTRIIACARHSVAVDPKWQPRLFEYAGFVRGILTSRARILPQPRIAFSNINWNVGGTLVLNTDLEFVDALDAENRRLREIQRMITRRRFQQNMGRIVLVFARQRSVDAFRRLAAVTRPIDGDPEIQTVTSAELSGITIDRHTTIVWAGSRASILDFYRTLSRKFQPGVDVSIVDIQDFPQSTNRAHSEFLQTVGGWNRERQRAYAELGYLPAGGDAQQHWLDRARRLLIQENQGVVRNV